MVSELTILKLQFFSALFMGYEYFVSSSIKEHVDNWAKQKASHIQGQSDAVIRSQITVLKKNLPAYAIIFSVLVLGLICFKLITVFERDHRNIWLALAFSLVSVVLIIGSFRATLDRLVIEGLAPMIIPLGTRVITTYLLFTSKGVIAGLGMLMLLISFWARYLNATA